MYDMRHFPELDENFGINLVSFLETKYDTLLMISASNSMILDDVNNDK